MTLSIFYNLQGIDTQQKVFLVKFQEHESAVRQGIAVVKIIFPANGSKFFPCVAIWFCKQMFGKYKQRFYP